MNKRIAYNLGTQAALRDAGLVKQAYLTSYVGMPLAGAAIGAGIGALAGGEEHRGAGAGIGAGIGGVTGLGLGGLRHWVANQVMKKFIENLEAAIRRHGPIR